VLKLKIHKRQLFSATICSIYDLLGSLEGFAFPVGVQLFQQRIVVIGDDRLPANLIEQSDLISVILVCETASVVFFTSDVGRINVKQRI
jgi:hypothetical protein